MWFIILYLVHLVVSYYLFNNTEYATPIIGNNSKTEYAVHKPSNQRFTPTSLAYMKLS